MMQCVRLLNVAFGFQTMLSVGLTFVFTLFTLFATYKSIIYDDIDVKTVLSCIYWCLFYNYFKVNIIFVSHRVGSEVEVLAELTYKMMNRGVCSPLILEAFGNQVKQMPCKVSCGLFNIDFPLIATVSEII